MATIVQKFGGTSVGDPERIRRCAERVATTRRAGHAVVVVVSAMGHATDELIELAGKVCEAPSRREMDMLLATGEQVSIALMAMALGRLGVEATSMTGGQLGIRTDDAHGRARIVSIDAARIRAELDAGRVVVAAGFQGVTARGEITTLGRGGSDTTAVAIAAALDVGGHGGEEGGLCEIYTDVDGVYTADPRLVASASKIIRISYEEMLELAALGAGVMHARAVMFGQKYGVPIHVRHSQRPENGTLIVEETPEMEDSPVVGVALKADLGRVSLRRIPSRIGVQGEIFAAIANANVMVDDIIQTEFGDTAHISFTVDHADLAEVKSVAARVLETLGTGELAVEIGLAKVSAVGTGMKSHTGVASGMFTALGEAGIPIQNITTSEIKISCIVPREHGKRALQVVHDAFGLGPDGPGVGSVEATKAARGA
ncbi:MAG TPA: aspartate kinase [Phycisphaerales bacterium]|nr:aspartate kinase [Phycisphaerales bacterium]HMP38557.1 aspartate kinase [Phycisphaerales bacterium]